MFRRKLKGSWVKLTTTNIHILMKKVLLIQNQIPPYRKPLYNELSKFYDITVLHSGRPTLNNSDLYNEIITKSYKISRFYFQKGVVKCFFSKKYEVIIVMFDVGWIMNDLGAFLKGSSKFLFWGHRYSQNRLSNRFRDFLMKRSDGVILYGEEDVQEMVKRGVRKEKIFIAYNTMFVKNYENGSNYPDKHRILFVGRAQKRKRVDLLIMAFAKITNQIPSNITLDIIGEGKENLLLKELTSDLKIENFVNFHGSITDEVLLKPFFLESIAYVSPGPVGLSVLQSFAYGVPVITNRNCHYGPEFNNIVHKWNGYIYDDQSELGSILVEYCNNIEKARYLGNNAFIHYREKRNGSVMVEGFKNAID